MTTSDTHLASWREKSAQACLATTVLIYVGYFVSVAASTPDATEDVLRFATAVVLQVVALTAIHIVYAARERPEPADERDRAISAGGERVGYWTLAVGVMSVALVQLTGESVLPTPWTAAQQLLFVFVLAECVRLTVQLVRYRRGF